MRRGTKLFLLAGCAWIVVLDAPAALAALAQGWRGPYAAGKTETAGLPEVPAGQPLLAQVSAPVELARR